jgi:hypothetical protein
MVSMSINITELAFAEGNDLTVHLVSGAEVDVTTKIDFQEHGILAEVIDLSNGNYLRFVPYSNILDIVQPE